MTQNKDNTKSIPFHFLDTKLCDRFLQDLSVELLLKLLRDTTAGPSFLFSGFRITSKNYRTPVIQKKLRGQLIQFESLRVLLSRAWLFAKEPTIEPHLGKVLSSLGSHDGALVSRLEKLQSHNNPLNLATTLVESLVWTEVSVNDIRILVSVVNSHYPNQEKLSDHVERLIRTSEEDPSRYIERARDAVATAARSVAEQKTTKNAILTERIEYEDKLKDGEDLLQKELLTFQKEVAELLTREEKQAKVRSDLETRLFELEATSQRTVEEKNELTNRQRRTIQKFEYEKNQLQTEIQALHQRERELESAIEEASNHHGTVKKNLEKVQHAASVIATQKKDQRREPTRPTSSPRSRMITSKGEFKIWLSNIRRLTTTPIPGQANEIGFIATPVSLLALSHMALDRREKDIDSVLRNGQWNDEALALFARRESKLLRPRDRQIAAEIALSGILHSLRTDKADLVDRQVLTFLHILTPQSPDHVVPTSIEHALKRSLGVCLQQWKRSPIITSYLGRLSLLFFDQFQRLFDISEQRNRLRMKQVLTACFGSPMNFEERDPSHEIMHIIATEYERRESTIRTASRRWMAQASLESIAQNARPFLMASISRLFQLLGKEAESYKVSLERGVSRPLTSALKQGRPSELEDLVDSCVKYMMDLMKTPDSVACTYAWPCVFHLAEIAMTAGVEAKRSFRSYLEVTLEKQYHPLKASNRHCPVQLIISNEGNADARNVRMLIMTTEPNDQVVISNAEPQFDAIASNNRISHGFSISCPPSTDVCELEYLLQWTDESEFERSSSGVLKLLSQRQIDWSTAQNPYSLKSIKDPERLKGRSDKLDILRRSWNSMDSYCITGQRRIGKSSVARVYQQELHKNRPFAAIYLQWGELGTDELSAICHNICFEMADLISERYGIRNLDPPAMENFLGNEGFVTTSFFSRLHRLLEDCRLFIIIDDFDELPLRLVASETGDRLFTILRSLMSKDFLALYLVGGEKVPEILRRQGERLNIMHRCDLDYIKRGEGIRSLVTDPAKDVLEFDREAVDEVVHWSAGNPYYATLICSRLFNDMASAEDYYVSSRDVRNTINILLEEDTLSNYQHFWKDGVFLPGKLGNRQQYHNAKVLIALARAESAEGDSIDRAELCQRDDLSSLGKNDVDYAIDGLLARKVISQHDDLLTIRVPLFSRWLSESSARTVEQSFAETDLIETASAYSRGITPSEIVSVAQDLSYQGRLLNEVRVEDWLSQFGDITGQRIAYKLLRRLRKSGYFNVASMFAAFKQLHQIIISTEASSRHFAVKSKRRKTTNILLSYLGRSGKSGSSCQYYYRQANKIHAACAMSQRQLLQTLAKSGEAQLVVFPDDIIGSGQTCIEAFKEFQDEMVQWEIDAKRHTFYLATVVATEEGQKAVEDATGDAITVRVWKQLRKVDRAFSEVAKIFDSDEQLVHARQLVNQIGKDLEPKHPLGWRDGQLMVAFEHGCPNNTLPIFHKRGNTYRGKEWRPLFPR